MEPLLHPKRWKATFKALDNLTRGHIDRAGFAAFSKGLLQQESLHAIFDKIDANNDGLVTMAEILQFSTSDVDSDVSPYVRILLDAARWKDTFKNMGKPSGMIDFKTFERYAQALIRASRL